MKDVNLNTGASHVNHNQSQGSSSQGSLGSRIISWLSGVLATISCGLYSNTKNHKTTANKADRVFSENKSKFTNSVKNARKLRISQLKNEIANKKLLKLQKEQKENRKQLFLKLSPRGKTAQLKQMKKEGILELLTPKEKETVSTQIKGFLANKKK